MNVDKGGGKEEKRNERVESDKGWEKREWENMSFNELSKQVRDVVHGIESIEVISWMDEEEERTKRRGTQLNDWMN